jgi:tetratricopeptide (TPR) repeat protein
MKSMILSLSAFALISAPVVAATSDFEAGLALYKKGDYQGALSFLKAAATAQKTNASAHYMLANTYLSLSQLDSALSEYREVYKLSPRSAIGVSALQVVRRYSSPGQASPVFVSVPAAPSAAPSIGSAPAGSPGQSVAELLQHLRDRLPPIPRAPAESSRNSEVLSFSLVEKANYAPEANSRLSIASQRLEDAEKLLTKVNHLVSGMSPTSRQFGESEEQLRQRQQDFRTALEESGMLRPYQSNVDQREKEVQFAQGIASQCQAAIITLQNSQIIQNQGR